jgi:AraC-like DNA-binding protein
VGFGEDMYSVNNSRYMLISTHIPALIKVEAASDDEPFVAIKITFTLEQIYEILKEIKNNEIKSKKEPEKGFFCDDMSTQLFNPIYRLVKLLETPTHSDFLVSLIEKEILYILLTSKSGDFLKQFVMEGSISNQIVKIVSEIKDNFSEAINMKELAYKFDMSESSLYSYFKKVMMISPLQFQKKLRLEEAKQMLLTQDIGVSDVAIAVGYDSSSHFIREYSRMYGLSPKAHIKELKYSNFDS